jgi:hypothetical protein
MEATRHVELPTIEALDETDLAALPGIIAGLAALQARAAARLVAAPPRLSVPTEPDELLDVEQAAHLIRRSTSWLRRHGHKLVGFSQPHGKGTAARWSRRALTKWLSTAV